MDAFILGNSHSTACWQREVTRVSRFHYLMSFFKNIRPIHFKFVKISLNKYMHLFGENCAFLFIGVVVAALRISMTRKRHVLTTLSALAAVYIVQFVPNFSCVMRVQP